MASGRAKWMRWTFKPDSRIPRVKGLKGEKLALSAQKAGPLLSIPDTHLTSHPSP